MPTLDETPLQIVARLRGKQNDPGLAEKLTADLSELTQGPDALLGHEEKIAGFLFALQLNKNRKFKHSAFELLKRIPPFQREETPPRVSWHGSGMFHDLETDEKYVKDALLMLGKLRLIHFAEGLSIEESGTIRMGWDKLRVSRTALGDSIVESFENGTRPPFEAAVIGIDIVKLARAKEDPSSISNGATADGPEEPSAPIASNENGKQESSERRRQRTRTERLFDEFCELPFFHLSDGGLVLSAPEIETLRSTGDVSIERPVNMWVNQMDFETLTDLKAEPGILLTDKQAWRRLRGEANFEEGDMIVLLRTMPEAETKVFDRNQGCLVLKKFDLTLLNTGTICGIVAKP